VAPSTTTASLELELDAFRTAVAANDPRALSACEGYTVHDVVAHVVAAANETSTTLESSGGSPGPVVERPLEPPTTE
jgi:mycothiol maleylpyruvate isomerase-like protein